MKEAETLIILIALFMIIEWLGRERPYAIATLGDKWPRPVRWAFYYILIITIFEFTGNEQTFIYFQF